ncbi:unnamed protein product [Rhodiola kirilowii]
MEPESSSTWDLRWIWFLECLATDKQVAYLTLRDVARKLPGLSGSAGMFARELLALRCLEGLAEMDHESKDAPNNGQKIGLDLSQRCSVALFRITSEAVNSSLGLDGLDVLKWDIQSFVKHKRAQLPKSTLERLEEMIIQGKDPAAVSLPEMTGIKIIDHPEDVDRFEGVAKGASSTCDGTSYHQVAAENLIPRNNNEKGSCQDISKDVSVQNASTEGACHSKKDGDRNQNVDGRLVGEFVMKTSRHDLESEIECSEVRDITCSVEAYHNEEIDIASCKNTFLNARGTTFNGTALALCIKCNKSGPLLCCNSSVCSVAVHRDCLGAAPCFDYSGNFMCPFCASSLASAKYLKTRSNMDIKEKELHVYLGSNLSKKIPQRVLNNEKKRHLKQDDPSYPVKRRSSEEKADTNRIHSDQNVEQGQHITPKIIGGGDVNSTRKSPAVCLDSDMPNREIDNKAMRHVDLGITDEPPILRAKDILPPTGRNTTTNSTTCQPRRAFAQPPLSSEGFEHRNSGAIVLYEGIKGYGILDKTSQNPPESKIKHDKAVRNFPNRMTSETTPHIPYQGYPAQRKRKVPWTAEEEEKLKEGVRRLYDPQEGPYIPWTQILEFGALVFHPRRTTENLKDKWRNICKKEGI